MQIVKYPAKDTWATILARPALNSIHLFDSVLNVINDVRAHGDEAVVKYTKQFDGIELSAFEISREEIDNAESLISGQLKQAIDTAAANIHKFHEAQLPQFKEIQTSPGVYCWQRAIPIEKIGLY